MRTLTSHKVNGLNDAIAIDVLDEPGAGGANHHYCIGLQRSNDVKSLLAEIRFQNGPIKEAGFNGLSNEALLAIVEDRLKGFQAGRFSCRENALALTKVQEAMQWLHFRTRRRVDYGIEGTNQPDLSDAELAEWSDSMACANTTPAEAE